MKGQSTIGSHRHLVSLNGPSVPIPDGEGGYTQTPVALDPPTWHCSIVPATARALERVVAGSVQSTATHILTGRFHPGITTQTTVTFKTRTFSISGVMNPEERDLETIALAVESVR